VGLPKGIKNLSKQKYKGTLPKRSNSGPPLLLATGTGYRDEFRTADRPPLPGNRRLELDQYVVLLNSIKRRHALIKC
jgi:hypothetical protein